MVVVRRPGSAISKAELLGFLADKVAKWWLLYEEATDPFDAIFIDADKRNNPAYLEWSLKLARAGTLIVGDNVVRDGAVAEYSSADPNVIGIRGFLTLMGDNPRLEATALQTVGSKGYDGFSLAIVGD
jgi:predicted O-methyltransferase YrrM